MLSAFPYRGVVRQNSSYSPEEQPSRPPGHCSEQSRSPEVPQYAELMYIALFHRADAHRINLRSTLALSRPTTQFKLNVSIKRVFASRGVASKTILLYSRYPQHGIGEIMGNQERKRWSRRSNPILSHWSPKT